MENQEPQTKPDSAASGLSAGLGVMGEKVTNEMVDAGFEVLKLSGIADEYLGADKLLVAEIYLAMLRRQPSQKASSEKCWPIVQ